MSLKELTQEYAAKTAALKAVFDESGPDRDMSKVKSLPGDSKAKVEKIQAMDSELTDLVDQIEKTKKVEDIAGRNRKAWEDSHLPAGSMPHPQPGAEGKEEKSLGALIMEKKDGLRAGMPSQKVDFEVKTLFQTTAGWAPQAIRIPRVEMYPARAIAVVDNIPQIPTTQAAIVYMEETTATFNAAEKAEGTAYAESAFALTQRSQPVEKVTTSLPVTDEQLEDVEGAEAYINQRLSYDIRRRMDLQVIEGNGTPPNLKGTLNIGGSLQTQAVGTDPVPDAIYKLFTKIRTVGFANPSVVLVNPNDWQPIRLLRTADGIYIWGSPSEAGPLRIWGVSVVETMAVTENTIITGDYSGYSALYTKRGLEVAVGYVNDDFTKGKQTLRADIRCAMVHFRTAAFGTVTGA